MPRQGPIKPEQPRSEPEIIPPARGRTQAYQGSPEWFAADGRGTRRIFVARLAPRSFVGIVLLLSLFAGAMLAILLSALLIAIPVVALLIAGALIGNVLRRRLRR